MKKNDWYGLGASLVLHLFLLLAFSVMSMGVVEPELIGYIEVDLGPFTQGQAVRRVVENQPQPVEQPDPEPEEEIEPEAAPPDEAKPVELPDPPEEIIDEEQLETPEAETISPVEQNNPAEVEDPEPTPEPTPVQPLGGGSTDGSTGNPQGEPGDEEDEQKTAPFQIEGLNRSTVFAPAPVYAEKVNADIKVRITVNPQGRIIRTFPVMKGNPTLEKAVRDALSRWRFNALPPNAPQENQTGIVTFRFRLE
ncbi:MAG: energy transducer TonB [Rhodothermales bacterium]